MHAKFLIATALTAALTWFATPATAQQAAERGIPHFKSPALVAGPSVRHSLGQCGEADGQRAHPNTLSCRGDGWAYVDSEWALYNNRSWDPDSYNDWWHDRPDRAYPRWVQEQRARGTCDAARVWWSGAGWHC